MPDRPITTTHEDRHRELAVANYYLCLHPDRVEMATVGERDFDAVPVLGLWISKARAKQRAGEQWSIVDVTVGRMDEYGPDWDGWMRRKPLIDWVIDATMKYSESLVPAMERHMRDRSILRDTVIECGVIRDLVHGREASTDDVLDRLSRLVDRLRSRNTVGWVSHAQAVREAATRYCQAVRDGKPLTLEMPWQALQDRLDGWPLGRLVMIQAITSGHKTTAGRQAAEHVARTGTPTAYITFEDPPEHIAARSMSADSDGSFTVRDLMTASSKANVTTGVVHVADTLVTMDIPMRIRYEKMTLPKLRQRLHEAASKDCKMVVVDFFQLIVPERVGETTTDFLARAANEIQGVAMDTGMAIILLVQPTQEATKRAKETGYQLDLGDIRGGSAIAGAAFGVLALGFEYDDHRRRVPDRILVAVRKWKTASTLVTVRLRLDAAHDRILDFDDRSWS